MTDFEKQLLASVEEMVAVKRGKRIAARRSYMLDVAAIRKRFGMSQTQFATLLDVSKNTLMSWEHGRRSPSRPARTLLWVAEKPLEVVR
jgi:putative transcriptional regulator